MIDVQPFQVENHYRVVDSAGAVVHEGTFHVGAMGLITYDDLLVTLPLGTYTIEPGAVSLTVIEPPPLEDE